MIKTFLLKKTESIDGEIFKQILATFPDEIQNKILAKIHLHDREITLFSQLLLRYCLSEELGINAGDLILEFNAFGKPFISNYPNCFFNLSHSGDCIVLALSDCEVGIDIEQEKEIDLSHVNHFFSKDETRYFHKINEDEKVSTFFKIWTLKECYLKALGTGLSKSLDSFSIMPGKCEIKVIESEKKMKKQHWRFSSSIINGDYHISVCTFECFNFDNIVLIDSKKLIKELIMN
jgi:4'-phosphopantetheinyl transferase